MFFLILNLAGLLVVIALVVKGRRALREKQAARAVAHPVTGAEDCAILLKAADIISRGNGRIVAALEDCARNHTDYFESWATKEEACWSGLVQCLISNNYAVEIDWREEDEFIFHELDRVVEKLGFPFRMDGSVPAAGADRRPDEDSTLKTLCLLASGLRGQGYALGSINISDCYVLFIIETDRDNEALLTSAGSPSGFQITFDFT